MSSDLSTHDYRASAFDSALLREVENALIEKNVSTLNRKFSALIIIPSNYLDATQGTKSINQIKSIDSDFPLRPKAIGAQFAYKLETLESIDLTFCENCELIDAYFCYFCTSIRRVSLLPLKNVKIVRTGFFFGAREKLELFGADVLEHASIDCAWLKARVEAAVSLMKVCKIQLKGKSRISQLFREEYAPRVLVVQFLAGVKK